MNYSISRHKDVLREAMDHWKSHRSMRAPYQGELAGTWAFGLKSAREQKSYTRAWEDFKRMEGLD